MVGYCHQLSVLAAFFVMLVFNTQAKTFNVSVLYWSNTIEGQVAMRYGLEKYVAHYNSNQKNNNIVLKIYVAGDGKNGTENQVKQFKIALKSNPDLIIIQPADSAALASSLKLANTHKVPVIAYDQYISAGELASFVTSDNYQAGVLGAEYVHSQFNSEQEIKVVVFEYPRVSSTIERVDGFFNTLRDLNRKFLVLARYEAVEPTGGSKAAEQFLKDFPKKSSVDVIFSVNDGGGLSVVERLVRAKRTEIKHATVDGDPRSLANIVQSHLTVIDSAQFCAEIGRQSARLGIELLEGKKIPKKLLVPTFPITKETLNLYGGWKADMPQGFKKKWKSEEPIWSNTLKEK